MSESDLKSKLQSAKQINIAVTGRKSGKRMEFPVWFIFEEGRLLLLPLKGTKSKWYRNVLKNQKLEVLSVKTGLISSQKVGLQAAVTPIADKARVDAIAEKFRAKYGSGAVKHHYHNFDAALEVVLP